MHIYIYIYIYIFKGLTPVRLPLLLVEFDVVIVVAAARVVRAGECWLILQSQQALPRSAGCEDFLARIWISWRHSIKCSG